VNRRTESRQKWTIRKFSSFQDTNRTDNLVLLESFETMRLGLDRRRSSFRNSSFSEGSEHSSIDQRANAVPAMTTEIETVPMEFDAVSLGSIDSLSSIDDPLLLTGIGDKATKGELPVFSSKIKDELKVAKYMEAREMTLTQERQCTYNFTQSNILCILHLIRPMDQRKVRF